MKVGELLELTKTVKLATIAKERLDFGEKKAVAALKMAGCYSKSGKPGWHFDGDSSVLEKSIYDFVPPTKATARKGNASIRKVNTSTKKVNNSTKDSIKPSEKPVTSELLANESETASTIDSNITREEIASTSETKVKSELDNIDMLLMQNETDSNKRVYRGFYWDKDIIDFVDNVKHGNKSDLMNEIVRTVLKAKGLI
jgi:hypothetical protein